jgi:nitroreductase
MEFTMNATSHPVPQATLSPIDALLTRASLSPRLLAEPGPSDAQLDLIIDAALRAPDHGNLKPVRFILIRGDARARFGDMMADATRQRDPNAPDAVLEKFRSWPRVAPVIIAVAASVRSGHAIPEIEQVLSAGASAMNILNAAHALGFTGMWVTGPNAYDPAVMHALGLAEGEKLIGFIGLGTAGNAPRPMVRKVDRAAYLREWTGT